MKGEAGKLVKEDISQKKNCGFCKESALKIGEKTEYGSVVVYKIGTQKNGWFATLSPKTGGDQKKDFTIQLMPFAHLTHFFQIPFYKGLGENYGTAFSKICKAMVEVMSEDKSLKALAFSRESGISIGMYGKCTTWKEKKEHLHIKVFPFTGNIGQPYTVDSSFTRKEIHKDHKTGEEFVKMLPVRKSRIGKKRFKYLSNKLISLLQ